MADNYCTTIPVLLIAFNRPEQTQKVFDAIRKARPLRLYIASDGPRSTKPGEEVIVESIRRKLLGQIDWPCEVKTNFRESNLGCKNAVSSAIGWLFFHEEMGIVLEDDCLPHESFFSYCESLLVRYQFDSRVGMISGRNHLGRYDSPFDYNFTIGSSIWGWASWKRVFCGFNVDDEMFRRNDLLSLLIRSSSQIDESIHLSEMITEINEGRLSTWDYQWNIYLMLGNYLSITPSNNMIENIGFGVDATHTISSFNGSQEVYETIGPLKHPDSFAPDRVLMKLNSSLRGRNKIVLLLKRVKLLRMLYRMAKSKIF